jgi:hypothetical protein
VDETGKSMKAVELGAPKQDGCCNIAILLIDLQKGETKAHACETAWFQQYNRAGVTCRKKSLSLAS